MVPWNCKFWISTVSEFWSSIVLDLARLKSSLKSWQVLIQLLAETWQVLSKSWPRLDKSCATLGHSLTSVGSRIEHSFCCWFAFVSQWKKTATCISFSKKLYQVKKKDTTTRALPQSLLENGKKLISTIDTSHGHFFCPLKKLMVLGWT